MIEAMITGTLATDPQERQTRDNKPFFTASLRVSAGEGDALFVSLTSFSQTAGERLLSLQKGANLAAVGILEQYPFTSKDGSERNGWRLTASEIMSVYQARKRRSSKDAEDGE